MGVGQEKLSASMILIFHFRKYLPLEFSPLGRGCRISWTVVKCQSRVKWTLNFLLMCPVKELLKAFTGTLHRYRVLRQAGRPVPGCTAHENFLTLS